jgi:hypothetical protein
MTLRELGKSLNLVLIDKKNMIITFYIPSPAGIFKYQACHDFVPCHMNYVRCHRHTTQSSCIGALQSLILEYVNARTLSLHKGLHVLTKSSMD